MELTHKDFTEVATLEFSTCETSFAILRAAPNRVMLVLSIEKNGDLQILLDSREAEKLAEAMSTAVAAARGRTA